MKQILLLFYFLTTLSFCYGQVVNRTGHNGGVCRTTQMVGVNSNSYYIEVTSSFNSCCRDLVELVGIGATGNESFRTLIIFAPYIDNTKIAVCADKAIIASGGTKLKGCDYGGALSKVCKVDSTGTTLWTITLNEQIDHIVALPDSGFALIIADDFRRFNKSGTLVSSKLLKSGSVNGICVLSSGNFLLSYQGTSGPRLRVMNIKDSTLSDIAFPSFLPVLKEGTDGNVYGINNGFLMKISLSSGLLLHSSGKLPANIWVNNVQIRNDSLFILASGGVSSINFLILDTGFNILHQQPSNITTIAGTGFYVGKNNQLNIITTGGSGYSYGGYFQTNLTGHIDATADIGVVGMTVLDSSHAQWSGMYRYTKVSADVIVKNYGLDTVRKLYLSHYATITGISFCLVGLHKQFTMTIPPGGSISINTGTFTSKPFNNYFTESYNYDLCFRATAPDGRHDFNTANDGLCRTIQMVPVGMKELIKDNSFSIYPNPVKGKLNISSSEHVDHLRIFDFNGRLLRSFSNDVGAPNEFEISLPEGVYMLRVTTKSGVRNQKFCFLNNGN